jgi:hypothetical protein
MDEQVKNYAVLTGDIIKSTTLPELDAVRQELFRAVDSVKTWKRGLVKGKPEFFRGDSWQLLLTNPGQALRVAIFIRAHLLSKSFDTRLTIGIGEVTRISTTRISLSTGDAFTRSGHALDELRPGRDLAISIDPKLTSLTGWLPVVAELSEAVIQSWSKRQAEMVSLALHPDRLSQDQLANRVSPPVDRQVVSKTLRRARFHSIESAVNQFELESWSK